MALKSYLSQIKMLTSQPVGFLQRNEVFKCLLSRLKQIFIADQWDKRKIAQSNQLLTHVMVILNAHKGINVTVSSFLCNANAESLPKVLTGSCSSNFMSGLGVSHFLLCVLLPPHSCTAGCEHRCLLPTVNNTKGENAQDFKHPAAFYMKELTQCKARGGRESALEIKPNILIAPWWMATVKVINPSWWLAKLSALI